MLVALTHTSTDHESGSYARHEWHQRSLENKKQNEMEKNLHSLILVMYYSTRRQPSLVAPTCDHRSASYLMVVDADLGHIPGGASMPKAAHGLLCSDDVSRWAILIDRSVEWIRCSFFTRKAREHLPRGPIGEGHIKVVLQSARPPRTSLNLIERCVK